MKTNKIITSLFLLLPAFLTNAAVQTYHYHPCVDRSELYSVKIGNEEQTVLTTDEPDFVCFGLSQKTRIDITYKGEVKEVAVRPLAKNYEYKIEGNVIHLSLNAYDRVSVEVNGDIAKPLFIFVNPIEKKPKFSKTDKVRLYKAGNIYDDGPVELNSFEKVYVEPGAIVRATFKGLTANNVSISGYGILDARNDDKAQGILFRKSHDVTISGPVLLNATLWSTVLVECNNSLIDNYKVIATKSIRPSGHENDGIHLFGTSNTVVRRCFSYCHDDAFVCNSRSDKYGWDGVVDNILFEDCVGWNYRAGNTFEIGYATRSNMSNITYRDIYAIHSSSSTPRNFSTGRGGIGVHHGSNASIKNLVYENVYIEDPWCMPIHFAILKTTYDNIPDWEGGHVDNVVFRNVHILKPGRKPSEFFGVDASHSINGVIFDGLYYGDKKINSLEQAAFGKYKFVNETKFQ